MKTSVLRRFLQQVRSSGVRRSETVSVQSMGRTRTFEAFDLGRDTFVFEREIVRHLDERPSVLLVRKDALRRRANGWVMTLSTGNHAVTAFPLLDGRFWRLSSLPADRRSETLQKTIVCANVVCDTIEISQREVATDVLVACDAWLQNTAGFTMTDIVMGERNETTLEHYRRIGQEWRIKPLAWTEEGMRVALAAARKRIGTALSYYHSARGVHFLSFAEFRRFASLAESDPTAFIEGLKELVGVFEGNDVSFARMPKHRGHHEVEFFGLSRGTAVERLVPELEALLESIERKRVGQLGVIQGAQALVDLFKSLLAHRDLADEESKRFVETLYIHITGEIYAVVGEGSTPAFDDRRTALPGASFVDGRPVLHPGADERTEVLLANLRGLMSRDERIEYANVYELRNDTNGRELGQGATREVVYKTNFRPLENSLVEKRLTHTSRGYGSYVLARIGALRALGCSLSEFYILLKRRPGTGKGEREHYIRRRCDGEPLETIAAASFRSKTDASVEDRDFILNLAALMGDAAAQNMVMKKFDPKTESPLYGVGKEIYAFEYDISRGREVPKTVSLCSVRGSFGWPSYEMTEENLAAYEDFYLRHFAQALRKYQAKHPVVTLREAAGRFMDGFDARTHALAWKMSVMRDRFDAFAPPVPPVFAFHAKWRFVMWALARQEERLDGLRKRFFDIISA